MLLLSKRNSYLSVPISLSLLLMDPAIPSGHPGPRGRHHQVVVGDPRVVVEVEVEVDEVRLSKNVRMLSSYWLRRCRPVFLLAHAQAT